MSDFPYTDWASMTDHSLIATIGQFVQHHRLNQNKSQDEVAKDAGISRSTLSLLERGEKVSLITLLQVLRVLDLLYIMDTFRITEEISPLEYAKLQKKKRQKASSNKNNSNPDTETEW